MLFCTSGSTITLSRLPKMRGDCTEARIDEREARAKLALVRRNASVAAKRRKTIVVELPPEVKYRAAACGEARCAAALAKEKLLLWFRARGGETHVRKMAAKAVAEGLPPPSTINSSRSGPAVAVRTWRD